MTLASGIRHRLIVCRLTERGEFAHTVELSADQLHITCVVISRWKGLFQGQGLFGSSRMSAKHPVVDVAEARASMQELFDQVSQNNHRVVVASEKSDLRCVLISEAELSGLEKALEILSGTNDATQMRAEVLRIALDSTVRSRIPAAALS
jgi:PHD/YefM family antitoxin component YafN of YafNO toxin-antitoxin module